MIPNDRTQAIAHHATVLMHHDTGQGTFAADARLFAELWAVLVPERGQATSIQGEVLRAVGGRLVEFLRTCLPNHDIFNAKQRARILQDLDAVVENGRDGLDANEIRVVFGRLIEDAVVYCQALPELVPNETVDGI